MADDYCTSPCQATGTFGSQFVKEPTDLDNVKYCLYHVFYYSYILSISCILLQLHIRLFVLTLNMKASKLRYSTGEFPGRVVNVSLVISN